MWLMPRPDVGARVARARGLSRGPRRGDGVNLGQLNASFQALSYAADRLEIPLRDLIPPRGTR